MSRPKGSKNKKTIAKQIAENPIEKSKEEAIAQAFNEEKPVESKANN